MKYRLLGNTGEKISAVGLGVMSMSYGYGTPNDEESRATLERAIDLGVNFFDTADVYGAGKNEEFIAPFIKKHRNKIFVATKFGFTSSPAEKGIKFDGSPKYIKTAVEASLRRLGVDVIDLYYAHRIDPVIPVEETVGAMAQLVTEGKVKYLGLCEASPVSIRKANAIHPISAVQSEYSVLTREVETAVLPLTRELGISFVPFSPLARGLMTNALNVTELKDGDLRKSLPRYQQEYQENNSRLVKAFADLARDKNCSPASLALAWVLEQGDNIIPIPGTKQRKYLEENVKAMEVRLDASDLRSIEDLLQKYPDTGPRYNDELERLVDRA